MTVVAADVGGSKTLLGWYPARDQAGPMAQVENSAYDKPEQLLAQFLAAHPAIQPAQTALVLAVAGAVKDHSYCSMTNLPWTLDALRIKQYFGFSTVVLLNDLEATALAMPQPEMAPCLQSLNGIPLDFRLPVTVISVGTGLGQSLLLPETDGGYRAVPAEGGHKSLAPFDATSAALVQSVYASGKTSLGWEEWISGSGLPRLYQAMFPTDIPLSGADISRQAQASPLSHAAQCLEFLTRALYAEAGNVALQYWSSGGVILAGGVAQHIAPWLRQASLREPFSRKSHHSGWLQTVPLSLCGNVQAAMLGAAAYGWHQQMHGN